MTNNPPSGGWQKLRPWNNLHAAVATSDGMTADQLLDLLDTWRPSWHQHALCRGHVNVMFPPLSVGRSTNYESALALCRNCPVVEPCRQSSEHEDNGVWGGVVREQRLANDQLLQAMRREGGNWSALEVADRFGWSERNAHRRLSKLLDRGLIVVAHHGHDGVTPSRFTVRREHT